LRTVAPKALSEREQKELLKKFREYGDVKAKEIVIETSMRLVYHIVKKFSDCILSPDELAAAGSVGLLKAADTFDPYRGTKFATYAGRCIQNAILMEIRWWTKEKRMEVMSLEECIGVDGDGNEMYLADTRSSDFDTEEEALKGEGRSSFSRDYMRRAGLKDRDIKVIYLRFGFITGRTHTQREIAERLGISRSYVSRIEKKSEMKLRKKYEALAD